MLSVIQLPPRAASVNVPGALWHAVTTCAHSCSCEYIVSLFILFVLLLPCAAVLSPCVLESACSGDTRGRRLTLLLSIVFMAVPTVLIGCLPTYAQVGVAAPVLLSLLRLVQGLAMGGEFGSALVSSVGMLRPVLDRYRASCLGLGLSNGMATVAYVSSKLMAGRNAGVVLMRWRGAARRLALQRRAGGTPLLLS
jgi:MFS family permease